MNIPQQWIDTLRAIQAAGFREAIIAGGCLRDLDNGVQPKDVDIFVQANDDVYAKARLDVVFGYVGEDLTQHSKEYHDSNPEVIAVYEWTHSTGSTLPFQVIVCSGNRDRFEFISNQMARFDIGLCKLWTSGRGVWRTSDYLTDRTNRTLTIVNMTSKSVERAERIGEKYPGWQIAGPKAPAPPLARDDLSFDVV